MQIGINGCAIDFEPDCKIEADTCGGPLPRWVPYH
jgi:hypothetical protein